MKEKLKNYRFNWKKFFRAIGFSDEYKYYQHIILVVGFFTCFLGLFSWVPLLSSKKNLFFNIFIIAGSLNFFIVVFSLLKDCVEKRYEVKDKRNTTE